MPSSSNQIRDKFDGGYLHTSLTVDLSACDQSELAETFRKLLPENQPVLEAGAGSGRWVAWFLKNGWQAYGIDWSQALCAQASQNIASFRFVCGDLRTLPFQDSTFSAVVALGSIEHVSEGPQHILDEFFKVVSPGGVLLVTVPFNSWFRKTIRLLKTPLVMLKNNNLIRMLLGKQPQIGITINQASQHTPPPDWMADFHHGKAGWFFYQYHFTKAQMRIFLRQSGFKVVKENVIMADSGVYNTLGRFGGQYDKKSYRIKLTPFGRLFKHMLGEDKVGHMLLLIAQK